MQTGSSASNIRVYTNRHIRNQSYTSAVDSSVSPSPSDALLPMYESVARYFSLLGEPTRLRILHAVCDEERCVNDIMQITGLEQPNVSRHLARLHQAGLLERRRDGSRVFYRAARSPQWDLCRLIAQQGAVRRCAPVRGRGAPLVGWSRYSPSNQRKKPVSDNLREVIGRVQPAPENHLSPELLEKARKARRSFMGKALAMGAGAASAVVGGKALAAPEGEDAILKLPEHTTGLGQPVAARGYGMPSKWESNLQRRESPGLTRVSQASVSFTPLQGLFGIITPSGLHFERHHQGWWDIDPSGHRLMIHGDDGLIKRPRV